MNKIKVIQTDNINKVFIDDKEIHYVSDIDFRFSANEIPHVNLKVLNPNFETIEHFANTHVYIEYTGLEHIPSMILLEELKGRGH